MYFPSLRSLVGDSHGLFRVSNINIFYMQLMAVPVQLRILALTATPGCKLFLLNLNNFLVSILTMKTSTS